MTETPAPHRLGYARVSTVGQTLEAQLEQLAAAGCATIYREKVSGAQANRKELNRLLKAMRRGDVLVVTRIDRLGAPWESLQYYPLRDFWRDGKQMISA